MEMFDDLFGGLFDLDLDGKTDALEAELGLSVLLSPEEGKRKEHHFADDFDPDDEDFCEDDPNEDDCEEQLERLNGLREELEELQSDLSDLESRGPDDILSDRYDRWEARKQQLEEQVSDLEDAIFGLELNLDVG